MVANSLLNKGMKERAFSLFKMNIEIYPTSYTVNKEMGSFYEKTGNREMADEYNSKSLILQYKLPNIFFQSSFNIEQYIYDRQVRLTKKPGIQPTHLNHY
jgi:hypothetical protein